MLNPLPRVVSRHSGKEEHVVLALSPEDFCFQGHFPGNPIVPGVTQVDWAIGFAQEAFGPLGAFQGMVKLKFTDFTRPGERLELYLAYDRAKGSLTFRYQAQGIRKSAGVLLFSGEQPCKT